MPFGARTPPVLRPRTGALSRLVLALALAAGAYAQSITISVSPTSVDEDAGATEIAVTAELSEAVSADTVVTLSLAGTASRGTDYTVTGTMPSITIPAGSTSASETLFIRTVDDTFWDGEDNETVEVNGSATGGLTVEGAEFEINDNESRPGIELVPFATRGRSEDLTSPLTILLSARLTGSSTFDDATQVTLSIGTTDRYAAIRGTDYTLSAVPTITIPAGGTTGSAETTITILDDTAVEFTEVIRFVGTARGASAGTIDFRIFDNDTPEDSDRFGISYSPAWVREQSGTTDISVTIARAGSELTSAETLTFARSRGFEPIDSVAGIPPSITFPAGPTTEVEFTIRVTATSDVSQDWQILFELLDSGANFLDEASVDLIANDTPVLEELEAGNSSGIWPREIVTRGEHLNLTATFTRFMRYSGGHSIAFLLGGERRTATVCDELGRRTLRCLYFPQPGEVDLDGIEPVDDPLEFSGATITEWHDTSVSITEVDPGDTASLRAYFLGSERPPVYGYARVFRLSSSIESVQEGAGPTQFTVTATQIAGNPLSSDITVPIRVVHGTTDDNDITVTGTMSIPVTAGSLSGSGTLTLEVEDDGLVEADTESFRIEGGNQSAYVDGGASIAIRDASTVSLSATPAFITEDGGSQAVVVTAELGDSSDGVRPRPIPVALSLSGTAGAGDYAVGGPLVVTIPANQRSGTATLTFTPVNDRLLEGTETIVMRGTTPGLLVHGTPSIELRDDEEEPEVILGVSDATILENEGSTQVAVSARLDPDITLPGTDTVVTLSVGGTATPGAGEDYVASWDPAERQITIPQGMRDGSALVTLTLTPQQDTIAEQDETIVVEAVSVPDFVVQVATVTLEDDDQPGLVLDPAGMEIREGAEATYQVSLAFQPTDPVTVTMTTDLTGTDLSISQTLLAFTEENWNVPQTVTLTAAEDDDAVADDALELVHEASGGVYEGLTGTVTATIRENDAPTVTVTPTLLPLIEGMSGSYTVVLNTQPTDDVTVTMTTDLAGTDLTASPSPTALEFTQENWDTAQSVTLSAAVDADAVTDPQVTLAHAVAGGDYEGVDASDVTVTIADTTVPVVSIASSAAPESAGSIDFTVTLSTVSDKRVTVSYATGGGTATAGADYTAATDMLAFEAGETEKTISVPVADDPLAEGSETFMLTLSNPANASLGTSTATGTIMDNDLAPTGLTLSLSPASVGEAAAATNVTVTAALNNSPLPTATSVRVSVTGGTATSGTDYAAAGSFTVTIQAGSTSGTATLSFDPTEDNLYEGDETVILTGSAAGLNADTATLTISDNDTAPTAITLSLSPNSVGEAAAATNVTVTAALNNSQLPADTSVSVSVTGGTATSGTDYATVSTFTVTIGAGSASGTATLSFDPTEDNLHEGDETVVLTGSATGLMAGTATLTISDNDTAPTAITLSLSASSVGEAAAATNVTVTAALNNSQLPTATSVAVSVTGGTATSGTDYAAVSGFTVTIPAGSASGTATLSFDPTEDSLYEGSETVILTGSSGDLTAGTATLTITDNDTAPTAITLSLSPASVGEAAAATNVTVTAALNNSSLPTATSVSVSVTGGTATSGTDYAAVTAFTVTIPAGSASGTATLSFDPTEDSLYEGSETVILTGSSGDLTAGTATLTITDNDTAPTAITLSLSPASVGEAAAATNVTVTAALNNSPLPTATSVSVSVTGGTATSGTDYAAVTAFTVTIPAGSASGTATLSFDPTEDSLYEGNETVILRGTATDLTAGTATLTISDNDTAPTAITLSLSPNSVGEAAAATNVTVTAALNNSPLPTATSVSVSVTGGTATSGTDYAAVSGFTVTIGAGSASGTATLSFDPAEDSLYEGDETVILTGSATDLNADSATLTITDNDTAPTAITLSLSPSSVGEAAAATNVTVTAALNNSQLPADTSVSVSVTGGTATSGTDYAAVSGFTVTIPAGSASGTATLSFDPTEDSLYEGNETVILRGTATDLTAGTATLTISDNDTAPTTITLSLSPASVGEAAAATNVTVTAALNNSQLPADTLVSVNVSGGTATSGTDYATVSTFTVTIGAGSASGTATLSFDPTEDNLHEGDETVILRGSSGDLTAGTATLTISDNDTAPTAITLSLSPSSVGEAAAATNVTVTAALNNSQLPADTLVSVNVSGGTATSGTDYAAVSAFTVTIGAGSASGTATLSFDPTEDNLHEGDETVILRGSSGDLTAGTATLTINDNDTAPTAITLSLSPSSVGEAAAATNVTVTATLNNSRLPAATTVSVSVTGGTATSGTDYAAVSAFTVTIGAGSASGTATLSFDPTEDSLYEGDETVILRGTATDLTSGTATLTISDNDTAPTAITLSLNPSSVGEAAAATNVTVTAALNGSALPTATSVSVSVTGGTATSGTDYAAVSGITVTIAAGSASGTATLSFDPTEDSLAEGNETVILTGSSTGLTAGTATLIITDNDTPPTAITLSLSPNSVGEAAAATNVTVTAALNGSALPTVTSVSVSVTGGTATSGTDYAAVSDFTVTIEAGSTIGTGTLSFDPTEDSLYEGGETVILTGSAGSLTTGSATLTITDNDTEPTAITLSLSPASVGEAAAATNVTVTAALNGSALPTATSVSVSVTGGTATSGTDYAAVSDLTVTIGAGSTSGTATLSFDPTEDSLYEGNETAILTGSAADLTSGTATLTITDNDTEPTAITLSLSPASVGEAAAATNVTVTAALNGSALPAATSVSVSVTGGTATSGTDYAAVSDLTVTIGAGSTSGTGTLSFDPTEDSLYEGNETAILTGSAADLTSGTATLTITDNDTEPTAITLSLSPNSVGEGAAATNVTVTAALNGSALPAATSVSVSVTGGTATSGTDYAAVSDLTVTIGAGSTSGTGTLSFDPAEDSLAEGDETVILTGSATDLTSGTARLTITDNDTPPTAITLSLSPNSVGEGAAATNVTVTAALNGSALPTATSVSVSVTGGTATSGTDYAAVSDFTVTIGAGSASGTATLSFDPAEDSLYEGDETVILTGSATDLTSGTARLTITDNDTPPTAITLSLSPNSVGEGAAATNVTVTAALNGSALPTATPVSVSVTGGTATSSEDYAAVSDFTVTIGAGNTSGTGRLSFDPAEDSLAEGDETVILRGVARDLVAGSATLTITDNDAAPTAITLSLSPNSVGEGAAATNVTVTAALNGSALPTATSVSVSVTGGTATSGTDYAAVSDFTVTIGAGSTSGSGALSFDPAEDSLAEGDETVILTGISGDLTAGTATLTITDNDAAPTAITLSLNPSSVGEGAAATNVTVTAALNGSALPTATSVSVSVTGGTATSDTDYAAISDFTVTIAEGSTSGAGALSFDPTDDTLAEGGETVILTGTAAGLRAGTATLTITDNDTPTTAILLSLSPASVDEGAGAANVTVTAALNGSALPTATTVSVSVTGGTATSGTDYAAIRDFTVMIGSGTTSGTGTLSFDPAEDSLAEGDETVILTGGATGLTAGTATLVVSDNDTAPTAITLSLNPATVDEGAATTSVTVTAALNGSALPVATAVSVSVTGGTATPGTDYAAVSGFTVRIEAGQASATRTLAFSPVEDGLDEDDETVVLSGTAEGLAAGEATLVIADNDMAPEGVMLSLNPESVTEGAPPTLVAVTASLDGTAPAATDVSVSVTGGTAAAGVDYAAVDSFTVRIEAGQASGTSQLRFVPAEDRLAEGDETVVLTGSATGLVAGAATLTITDNDAPPTAISLSLSPAAVAEAAAATAVTVTATLNGVLPAATDVSVSVTGGTATAGVDYATVSGFTVTIPAERTSANAQLSFDPAEDADEEGDETVVLTGAATGLEPGTATLTITDAEPVAPALTLTLQPGNVSEGAAVTTVTVTAAANVLSATSTAVSVSVTGGTATAGEDYAEVGDFAVTIAAGQASGQAQVAFEPLEDTVREGSETVVLTGRAVGLAEGTATLRITDNDQAPQARRQGGPPRITIWTDRLSYRIEDEIRVYLDIDPKDDEREYTLYVYRESIDTGERLYLARSMALWGEVVDYYGRDRETRRARAVERVEKELVWEGHVPQPGLWHFVAELRSPGTTQVLKRAYAKFVVPSAGSVLLNRRGFERSVGKDLKLTNDRSYHLGGRLLVKSGATLTVEAGTVVQAFGPDAEIMVEPGARIMALGRREAPVVMTCSLPLGERSAGCWGGLRIFGRAPVRDRPAAAADSPQGTGIEERRGGSRDSSGALRYLRVEFAAGGAAPGAPAAAVELHGVGTGTLIDHVQVHASLGDGFRFRGGAAHCSHCVASYARHDSLAWDGGWRGSAQYLYIQQGSEAASAIRGSGEDAVTDGAAPMLYNATLVGGYNIGVPGGAPGRPRTIGPGIVLEGEAAITARNVLATGFGGFAIEGSIASFARGQSSFSHAVLVDSGFRYTFSAQVPGRFKPYVEYVNADPRLLNIRFEANPDPRPRSGSAALRLGHAAVPPFDARFAHSAHYVGAFRTKNWLEEWTFFGPEQDYEVPVD